MTFKIPDSIADLITILDQLLVEQKISFSLDGYFQKRLPKAFPFVGIANLGQPGIDELVLLKSFLPHFPTVKVFSEHFFTYPDQIPSALKLHFTPTIEIKPTTAGGILFQSRRIAEAIQQTIHAGIPCIVILNYQGRFFQTIRSLQQNRHIIKQIKRLKIPVAPILQSIKRTDDDESLLKIRLGSTISVGQQNHFSSHQRFGKYIQLKVLTLGSTLEINPFFFTAQAKKQEFPLAPPTQKSLLVNEIQSLKFGHLVFSRAQFDVYVAEAKEIPYMLNEIGRLREKTFREVGEGTGRTLDLDEYDLYYNQLFIWDRDKEQLVGGYRLGRGDEIFRQYGVQGFYIYSLFKIQSGFYPILKKSVELGRSFIEKGYQKHHLPLFLLWKGILHFLLQNPRYQYIFGPVSISKFYSNISKSLIVAFIREHFFDHKLAQHLSPRQPFQVRLKPQEISLLLQTMDGQLSKLDHLIEDIEPEHIKLPVLIKQYARQNAKFISFNVDPHFSDVLDGFMLLDLQELPVSTIEALKKE